ncbi:MAG: HD-GYP domain-containing protein [Deltaproteobacteria bacterium]|nr:HD-GYP domain-containing protein [Deltaproteobacteria bacterium]
MARYKVYDYGSRKAFPADKLSEGTYLPFDVFVCEEDIFSRLFKEGDRFGPEEKAELWRRGATEVYVDLKDARALELYLQRTAEIVIPDRDNAEVVREYVEHKQQYYQVDRSFLKPGVRVGFGVYLLHNLHMVPLVEATESAPGVVPEGISASPGEVVIRNSDIPLYQKFLDSLIEAPPGAAAPSEDLSKVRAVVIKEKSKTIIKGLLEDPRSGENIKDAVDVVTRMTDCIVSNRDVIYDLVSLSSYDHYTYTHSVNVTVISVGIGIAYGIGRAAAEILGLGALLHDVGKSRISPAILNKPGKFTPEEYNIIKGHVIEGEKILREHKAIHPDAYYAVLQHHERLGGTGYPYGVSEESIRLFGRICAIADCYDAMTTHRPYQRAASPYQALLQITKETRNYDRDLLKAFIRMLGKIKGPEVLRAEGAAAPV